MNLSPTTDGYKIQDDVITRLQQEITDLKARYSQATEDLINHVEEVERLEAALKRYGHHIHPNCHDLTLKADGSFGPRNGCLCGFDAAVRNSPEPTESST